MILHRFLLHELRGGQLPVMIGIASVAQKVVDYGVGDKNSEGPVVPALRFVDIPNLLFFCGEQA